MKYVVIAIFTVLAISYGAWNFYFSHTGHNNIKFDSKQFAYDAAQQFLQSQENSQDLIIQHTQGSSNNWGGESLSGFLILDTSFDFEKLKKNDFVVAISAKNQLVHHRLIEKTQQGWKMQGDGNKHPDNFLVTNDNFIGLVVKKTIFRYENQE